MLGEVMITHHAIYICQGRWTMVGIDIVIVKYITVILCDTVYVLIVLQVQILS